ncbi:mitogen-activated protein kinase [Sporothrix curviconia]|uniref:cyclin-dependent kinase n=1 Tax=Sporothrix curviconia TaxID=1260050 RepID=A0ABP0CWB6_9PEZI
MAAQNDWRRALTATERFNNIQSIEKAAHPAALTASALTLENDAYTSSSSREDYDAACALLSVPPGSLSATATHPAVAGHDDGTGNDNDNDDGTSGIDIGSYKNCRYLASGTSSAVYRSGAVALKVCTISSDCAPHNVYREAKILKQLQATEATAEATATAASTNIIQLHETFHDADHQLVLVLPYMPLTLQTVLQNDRDKIPRKRLQGYFVDILRALAHVHRQGIVHRDVKPSAILLWSIDGPACLSDFGTAWHPVFSADDEPADAKVLDIGTGPYRAPEALFGNQAYGPPVDMWAVGAMLAESARPAPHRPLFESRAVHEDGNQLGLILSIFKTVGTPTRASWPEAASFRTPPFEMYRVFAPQPWTAILPDVDADVREIVASLVKYSNSTRLTAEEVGAVLLGSAT